MNLFQRTLLGFSVVLAGVAAAQTEPPPKPVSVLATIGMIADLAENVAGECAQVTALMGPGIDPHLYQASARDVQRFSQAEVIFYSGYSLEGQLGNVLARLAEMKSTVGLSEASIGPDNLISVQDGYGTDPHLWMDVSLWAQLLPTIADTLAAARPGCAEGMRANAERYQRELLALHDWVKASIATIPQTQRVLVTAHDAFGYYGRAYGLEVAGIQGVSTESEAGVADIRDTAELITERQIPALFVESTINPRPIQAVIAAARDRGLEVRIGGELYSDAMGESGTAGGTYIGMIVENTRHITEALGGTPPALPDALHRWARAWDVQERP